MLLSFDDVRLLVSGCPRHLPYRGNKEPSECEVCTKLYHARQRFNEIKDSPTILSFQPSVAIDIAHPAVMLEIDPIVESVLDQSDLYTGGLDARCYHCGKHEAHSTTQHSREITSGRRR